MKDLLSEGIPLGCLSSCLTADSGGVAVADSDRPDVKGRHNVKREQQELLSETMVTELFALWNHNSHSKTQMSWGPMGSYTYNIHTLEKQWLTPQKEWKRKIWSVITPTGVASNLKFYFQSFPLNIF